MSYAYQRFEEAFKLLNGRLSLAKTPEFRIVVCGGTALLAAKLANRVTRDVDIVALADNDGILIDPAPLPPLLLTAASEVQGDLGLPIDWLNNGPSSGVGGLFQLGLPEGLTSRLSWQSFGTHLSVGFISRFDQIHFKLYAAVDQAGGYHATDLITLKPTDEELLRAVAWTRSHDPSDGYVDSLKRFFREFGYEHLVHRI